MSVYSFLADGFEEIEALAVVDILRRAKVDVKTVSVNGKSVVTGAHGIPVTADLQFEELDATGADLLILPGGLPGATNLADHAGLREVVQKQYDNGGMLAAICAAPLVFGRMGLLQGRKATCYPGIEPELKGAETTGEMVQEDGPFITGKGPAAANAFGLTLVERLRGKEIARVIAQGMLLLPQ